MGGKEGLRVGHWPGRGRSDSVGCLADKLPGEKRSWRVLPFTHQGTKCMDVRNKTINLTKSQCDVFFSFFI